MIRIIEYLLHGCWHNYRPINARPTDHYDISFGRKSFMYTTWPARCTKCGRISCIKDKSGSLTYRDIAGGDA